MRPRTLLQKEVWSLYQNLRPVTQKQLDWGVEHAPQHHCLHNPKTHRCVCMECGYQWIAEGPSRCPNCGRTLSVTDQYRKRTFEDHTYFNILQRKGRFIVIRVFYLYKKVWRNRPSFKEVTEVAQHWIDDQGKESFIARSISMCYYYRNCPFALHSDLSLKSRVTDTAWHYSAVTCPGFQKTPILKRNGMKSSFHGIPPVKVIRLLLRNNHFETLWKLGMFRIARYYANSPTILDRYWTQVMLAHKRNYTITEPSIWFDYLELLVHFGKDIHCPKYIFPEDLRKEHDRYVEKRRREQEALRMERERERRAEEQRQRKENRNVFRRKRKYFGITFGNKDMQVIVLSSITAYRKEGDLQHHCVYTNGYYGKEGTLILSARMKDAPDIPVETIELSLKDGSILQCYGKYNQPTEHHETIMNLVSRNAGRFLNQTTHLS